MSCYLLVTGRETKGEILCGSPLLSVKRLDRNQEFLTASLSLEDSFLSQYKNNQNITNLKQWHKIYHRNCLSIAATYILLVLMEKIGLLQCFFKSTFLVVIGRNTPYLLILVLFNNFSTHDTVNQNDFDSSIAWWEYGALMSYVVYRAGTILSVFGFNTTLLGENRSHQMQQPEWGETAPRPSSRKAEPVFPVDAVHAVHTKHHTCTCTHRRIWRADRALVRAQTAPGASSCSSLSQGVTGSPSETHMYTYGKRGSRQQQQSACLPCSCWHWGIWAPEATALLHLVVLNMSLAHMCLHTHTHTYIHTELTRTPLVL